MIKIRVKGSVLLIITVLALLTSCTQDVNSAQATQSPSATESDVPQSIAKLEYSSSDNEEECQLLLPTDIWLCNIGDTYRLEPKVSNASVIAYRYISDAEDIVAVDDSGKLEVRGRGVCHIYVTAELESGQWLTGGISVMTTAEIERIYYSARDTQILADRQGPHILLPTDIWLRDIGETYRLEPFVTGTKAVSYQYSSEAEEIVTVDKSGKITAKSGGFCRVYVTAELKSGKFLNGEILISVLTGTTRIYYVI